MAGDAKNCEHSWRIDREEEEEEEDLSGLNAWHLIL